MKGPLSVLSATVLLIAVASSQDSADYLLTGYSNPMSSSLAHQFFNVNGQKKSLPANGTQLVHSYQTRDEETNLCQRDINRIRDGLDNMEEWAMECKYFQSRQDYGCVIVTILDHNLQQGLNWIATLISENKSSDW